MNINTGMKMVPRRENFWELVVVGSCFFLPNRNFMQNISFKKKFLFLLNLVIVVKYYLQPQIN